MMALPTKPLMTVKQVAELFQVSTHCIYKWVESGKLPHVKLGGYNLRFDPEAIEKFIQKSAA